VFGDLTYPSFIFWPVGCGDSTTIPIVGDFTLQIDINDGTTADNTDNERIPVVDELVAKLPRLNGKPYLSCFALTHPDLDHVKGFKELLKRVVIGELWFTPRVFWEYKKELSPDALAFCEEAQRRVKRTIAAGGDPGRGNRVRLIGYDDLLGKDDYRGFPRKFLTIPGQSIEIVDGQDLSQFFSSFVHAPSRTTRLVNATRRASHCRCACTTAAPSAPASSSAISAIRPFAASSMKPIVTIMTTGWSGTSICRRTTAPKR
jgi:hypothetical protein